LSEFCGVAPSVRQYLRLIALSTISEHVNGFLASFNIRYVASRALSEYSGTLCRLGLRSFNLKRSNPTVTVEAAYSKHRRDDIQLLHPDIVERFLKWLEIRKPESESEILFPISNKTCEVDRRTSEMMMFDLNFARNLWLTEAKGDAERQTRSASDFLRYQDSQGKFADFHALRHTFITNLSRANVSPKVAQTLARHSDIRLTMQIYTHIDSDEQAAAINSLPGLSPKN
jgi:integrase